MAKRKKADRPRLSKWVDEYVKSLPAEASRGFYDDETLGAVAMEGLSFVLEKISFTVAFVEFPGHAISMTLAAYPVLADGEIHDYPYMRSESYAATGHADARMRTIQYCNKLLRNKLK